MSRLTAASHSSLLQALTPLGGPPTTSTSSLSSSSSAVSRQSSCRSTASVQAVPFRTPIRGNGNSNMTYGTSGIGRGFDSSGTTSSAAVGGSYFSGAPMERRGSENGGYPGSANESSTALGLRAAAAGVVSARAVGEERPDVGRLVSETLSDRPATEEGVLLRKTAGDFVFGDVLGEGSYSTVSLVTDKHLPNKQYALKVLDKEHIKREKKTKYVLIERDTLKTLDGHPGIVRLYWTFQDARSLYYVLELAKNGELLKWIKKFGSFSLPSARFYAAQILSAVEHMHSKGVIHRDLKPENILLDDNMRIKVTDFGTAKLLGEGEVVEPKVLPGETPRQRSRSFVGTPEYVSPEILSEKKESSKSSDYWGFGCILFQMLAGHPPFQARTEYLMFQKIINLEYTFPPGFPSDAQDLVSKLLVLDPLSRLGGGPDGISAIKSHPFFTSSPSIDFSTIWTSAPPEIETGLAQPKKEERGEFVMPEGLEGLVSEEGEMSDEEGPRGRGGEGSGTTGSGSPMGEVVREVPRVEPATKWTGILLPRETILFASPVLDRGGFLSKKRTLILTDYPRLICIKETVHRVTLKSETFIANPGSSAKPTFLRADAEGDKIFLVRTSQRTFKYEEPTGGAARWVAELREAQEKGVVGRN